MILMGFFGDLKKDLDKAAKAERAESRAHAEATAKVKTKDKARTERRASAIAAFGSIELQPGARLAHLRHATMGEVGHLRGAQASVESGAALESRITATRIVLTGVFALAWRKKTGGESWLTIEGSNFFWVERVERSQVDAARRFAAAVNSASRKA